MGHTQITHTKDFGLDIVFFNDMVAIDDNQYFLASKLGLQKTTKDKLLKHYFKDRTVMSLCDLPNSQEQQQQLYLVGFSNPNELIVWSENSDQLMFRIPPSGEVYSIKRVIGNMSQYIIKSDKKGV